MEIRPCLLGHRGVRRIADQEVPKTERLVAGEVGSIGPDQLLAQKGAQVTGHRFAQVSRGELGDSTAMEDLALDGATLDHRPLEHRQAVKPRGEEGLDGWWNCNAGQACSGHPDRKSTRLNS